MALTYDHLEEAQTRLQHTVITYHGEPVYVESVSAQKGGGIRVSLWEMPLGRSQNEPMVVSLDDPGLGIEFKLGYMNYEGTSYHLSRMPARRWRQGLYAEIVKINVSEFHGRRVNWDNSLRSKGLVCTLNGNFPKMDEAVDVVTKGSHAFDVPMCAVSRTTAIVRDPFRGDLLLFHRNKRVGWGTKDELHLAQEFTYLKEAIIEEGLKLVA